ncbi:MAG: DUF6600 domain-containing protein, partial [Rhodanobacteraceae bacterium]
YRIDDDPSGTGTMVTVFQGSGTVYGENGVSRQVAAGTSYRLNDSALASVDVNGLPQPDDFDRFCQARDANYDRYAQAEQQYVPPDMIGGDELDQYGQWNDVPEYGNVWYPTTVPVGWAPYRYGHWAWIDPWGWTWVGDEPWGFAPFHYGRWAYISNRWGWVPGPINVRPLYAPALVAFVGGSGFSLSIGIGGGGPVGWFPLGPRDIYTPWFPASRSYFTNVNVTNIRNVYVNKTVINNFYGDYRAGRRPPIGQHDYTYRRMPGAVTAVPRNVFVDARPVHPAVLKLDRTQLARTQVAVRPGVNPAKASLGLRRAGARPAVLHGREPFVRPVVARHAPPPRPVSFAAREKIIANQHGRPLSAAQMRNLRTARPATEIHNERVKLVAGAHANPPGAKAIQSPHARAGTPQRVEAPSHGATARTGVVARPEVRNGRPATASRPAPARNQPAREAPLRAGELPSARFRHPQQPATLPRTNVIRAAREPQHQPPASGRLPVVRPVERASQSLGNRTEQRNRQADIEAQQRARTQRVQQQRQLEQQSQQRLRAQQGQQRAQAVQQQRVREQQAQQRAREPQMQQQREAQMQSEQRAREGQMRQQQQMQQMRVQQTEQAQRAARERAMQRPQEHYAPRPTNRPAPEHRREPPPRKPPASSSGNRPMR